MSIFRTYLAAILLFIGRFRPQSKTKSWVAGAGAGLGAAGLGATQLLSMLGFSAVVHSSGATILTGAGGYIAGTYGIAAVVALVTAPFAVVTYLLCLAIGFGILTGKEMRKKRRKTDSGH